MTKPKAPTLHESVGLSLVLLARLYRRALDAALKPHNLSEATTLPLRYLGRLEEGVRQGVLANALALEGPTLIRVLDQLEGSGLIRRVADPGDRRGTVVELTDAGIALNTRLSVDLQVIRKQLFEGIAESDLEACLRAFEVMISNLRPECKAARRD